LFCGDLGNEVNDDVLTKAFSIYPSFNMARVIRDKWTGKTKGYGFVSFANASDLAAALKEMNGMGAFSPLMHPFPVATISSATYKTKCHAGKYVGNRPIKLRKSTWKNRIDFEALEKGKTQPQKKIKPQKRSVLHK
jgi:RNA recognition motif-containing protein